MQLLYNSFSFEISALVINQFDEMKKGTQKGQQTLGNKLFCSFEFWAIFKIIKVHRE